MIVFVVAKYIFHTLRHYLISLKANKFVANKNVIKYLCSLVGMVKIKMIYRKPYI